MRGVSGNRQGGTAHKKTIEAQIAMGKTAKDFDKAPKRSAQPPRPMENMSPQEKKAWATLEKVLTARGQWTQDNEIALQGLVIAIAEVLTYRRIIQEMGHTYSILSTAATRALKAGDMRKIEFGPEHYITKIRPEVQLMNAADRRLRSWLCEFGLTDATRARVQVEKAKNDDEVLEKYGLN